MRISLIRFEKYDGMIEMIKNKLNSLGIEVIMVNDDHEMVKDSDFVIISGGDKGILRYFNKVGDLSPPVLGIHETGSTNFLSQVESKEINNAVQRLRSGEYNIDEMDRILVNIDGKNVGSALNDVAIFPFRSATLMEYKLRIDGEDIWRDNSDGVLIATPIGSTAYSLSAGGPIVLRGSKVFIIVSINSLDVTRKPLIVSEDSRIEIDDIISRYHCEVIIDGEKRIKVNNKVICIKHEYPARFVRFSNQTVSVIAKKVRLAEEMLDMPPSVKLVLKILEYEGPMSQKDLVNRTMLPARTVRLALSHLLKKGYVTKKVSLRDVRQRIYELKI